MQNRVILEETERSYSQSYSNSNYDESYGSQSYSSDSAYNIRPKSEQSMEEVRPRMVYDSPISKTMPIHGNSDVILREQTQIYR